MGDFKRYYMTTKYITYGETAATIKTRIPAGWPTNGTWTVSVSDKTDADYIVEDQSVTQYAGDTIAAAAKAGAQDIVLVDGTALKDGDLIIVGSDAQGWQEKEVARYIASTQTVTLRTRLDEALIAGSEVRGLDLSAVIDASGWSTSVRQVSVYWYTDGHPSFTELYDVRSMRSGGAGLETEFDVAYSALYNQIDPQNFPAYEARARERIKQEMTTKGRNVDLIVDSQALTEITLTEIALLIGRAVGMDDTMWDRLEKDRQYQMIILDDLHLWVDDNEDTSEDEDEDQPAMVRNFARGLF